MTSPVHGSSWLDSAIELAFPPLCLGCGAYTPNQPAICDACVNRIDKYAEPFCLGCKHQLFETMLCPDCREKSWLLFAYGNYRDPLQEVIIHFKFRSITHVADTIAEAIVQQFRDRIQSLGADYLVPIPLHPLRQLTRGYNQAELFADALSGRLDIPVASDFLRRTRRRKEQARLSEHERERNIRGVFEAMADADPGESVILIDDVVTSGATVREAKRVLVEAGFDVPAAISMAHGL